MRTTEFISYISTEKRFSQHTINAYSNDLESFFQYLNTEYELNDYLEISQEIIRSWIVYMIEQDNKPSSINRKISTINSYFNFLLREGKISKNPASQIPSLKTPVKLPVYFKEDQLLDYLDGINDNMGFGKLRNYLVIYLLYFTGIRRNELINLKEKDIDFSSKSLKVVGKRNKERIVPLSNRMVEFISIYLKKKNNVFGKSNTFIVLTNKGKKAYPKLIYRIVNKELSSLTGARKSPHVLRHTFATHMLNHGAELNSIKELLGHANLNSTQVYTHNSVEKLKEVYKTAHPRAKTK